ncbi:unnamed protein product [Diamesa serratosioi]
MSLGSEKRSPLLVKALEPEEEIVITGISGRYPNSSNFAEFSHNLYNKIDMVDDDERRWRHTNPEIPSRMGKISNIEKFDATFFGVHHKQAFTMDPQCRMLIEHAYEAVMDAGVNPKSIRGSRTGVFIGACFAESEKTWFYETIPQTGFGITGCSRAMLANRISFTLGLTGPSFMIDTACSSSMYALDSAFKAIRNGDCDAAIVGGTNLLLNPSSTLQFARLGVLAKDGYCRPFDKDACGYTRADAVCTMFIQKIKNAKRNYANIVYSKTNCDGHKQEGITYPSGKMQMQLLSEFYQDINLDPSTVSYVEAHSTGTVVGDPEECNALDKVFCAGRTTPLPVGSIKSNMGHSEATSGVCSISKVILTFENNLIPPNINFKSTRTEIPALAEGRLQVVQDPQKLDGPLISINSFGFGGANAHALFKSIAKDKINNGAPSDKLPRLVTWCGRTEEAVDAILNDILKRSLDAEHIGLLHNTQLDSVPANVFRGYGVFAHKPNEKAVCLSRSVQHYSGQKRPIVWLFSGMGSQWTQMGLSLMEIPLFRTSIENCHNILASRGLNLKEIITSSETTFDNILHSFVGIAAIQIGLVDILKTLGMEPDLIIGHSVGELGCAYADGCFTAEEMILSAYSRGMASLETKVVLGSMAAIGVGYKKLRSMTPPEIEIACHNSADSCTISGPAQSVTAFVKELKSQEIFAKEVPCSNIPYHSSYISEMGPKLLSRLTEVIKSPKKRSAKWLSSSVPKQTWDQESCQYSSAQYHTNNLLSPVLFEETAELLPKEALTIEIAPHGLLQAIIKKSMLDGVHIPLTQRGHSNNAEFLIQALGKIHVEGVDIQIPNLYPAVKFPVSRGTATVSSLIKWDHSEDWFVSKFEDVNKIKSGERKLKIVLSDLDYEYMAGHTIDGRVLFPATAYLFLAWDTLALMKGLSTSLLNVEFEDIKFLRATSLSRDIEIDFLIMIHPGTGNFEISENGTSLVTGTIRAPEKTSLTELNVDTEESKFPTLTSRDFYKELRLRGYHYNGVFRSVVEARSDGLKGKVRWDMNWVAFMDCLLQIQILGKDTRLLILPTGIQRMTIDALKHMEMVKAMEDAGVTDKVFDVKVTHELNIISSGGIEIVNLQANVVGRRRPPGIPVLEYYKFIPHFSSPMLSKSDGARVLVQLALENVPTLKIKAVEIGNQCTILPIIQEALADLPLVTADLTLLSEQTIEIDGIVVDNGNLSTHTNCLFIIASDCINDHVFIESSVASLEQNGFFVAREKSGFSTNSLKLPTNFHLLSLITLEDEVLVLLQYKKKKVNIISTIIEVSEKDTKYEWLEKTKQSMKSGPIILIAQNEKTSGIIGLVNCLRKEPDGEMITCVFIDDDKAPLFDLQNPLYSSQLNLGLAINVLRNGKWGSYRHLQIQQTFTDHPARDHCYVNALIKSDLSSLKWISGPFNYSQPDGKLVKVQYASLNFRDVMLATGKLTADVVADNRLEHECVLGFEFSGITKSGKRVMGMTATAAMATHVEMIEPLTFNCPDDWTLAEAATVPAVYGTVYSAFFITAKIEKGKSILIHAGSGGVGLAAIRVAFAYGLEVFTTVSTTEKKNYLLQEFPQLKEQNIGNSRDISFEKLVLTQTKGKGVDYVLNSLAEEKLHASIRCLGRGGKFLEIGKFDMANDTKIGLGNFLKEISFHSIMLDKLFKAPKEDKLRLRRLVETDLVSGIIKPLKANIFAANQVEQAFRFLASGKHIGKVILQVRENENDEQTLPITVIPRVYCSPVMSYIIPGGLGGFGLELADWLVLRGCRNLVLSSSRGISKQYQSYRIKIWESYGVRVAVSIANIKTNSGCEQLLQEAMKLGQIGGIFNLAVTLKDSILENQDQIMFDECMAPKAVATKHLDKLSRKLCPYLQYFVVFSSVSCGRGNAGQSNYGMANSVMERVMEQRHKDGLPAKAIQWGAVGEVGLVADMQEDKLDMEIGGTLQQRISSCLDEMDTLMTINEPIVASMVVAEKVIRSGGKGNIIESVMNIMSIRDIKSISMDSTLSELGMDSLMAVEIKQTLEREYELFLSPQDLRALTFMKLKEFTEARDSIDKKELLKGNNAIPNGLAMLLRNLGDEANCNDSILQLKSIQNSKDKSSFALIVPGIEGMAGKVWYNIASSLDMPTYILQLSKSGQSTILEEIITTVIQEILEMHKNVNTFYLIGYSFGSMITLELARILEESGLKGNLVLIDGSPMFLKKLSTDHLKIDFSDETIQTILLANSIQSVFPDDNGQITKLVLSQPTWEERLDKLVEFIKDQMLYTEIYLRSILIALVNRIKLVINLDLNSFKPLKHTFITLIRPTEASVIDIDEDYGISSLSDHKVNIKFVEGNHITMLDNHKLTALINDLHPNKNVLMDKHIIKNMDYKPDKEYPQFSTRAYPATPEDEIVISGISGRFPNSNNVRDFSHNLYNKIDMVDDDERRWRNTNAEIPTRMGKINNVEKFDAKFFGVHHKQAYTMDPQCRVLVEHAYEAILDAGVNPKSIRGSRTGVFIGAMFVDTEKTWFFDSISKEGFGMTGCSRAMLANRVSFVLGLTGPSFLLDASCSSSLFALNSAFNAIRNGECDAAIVGGSNLLLNPSASLQFARLGVLAKDGFCRPFDKDGLGYTRADGICVIYLQKIKNAKRNYTNLVYSKTNCNGFKEDGILFPSGQMQINLMNEFYNDIQVNPNTVSYVEALTGNSEECKALDQVYCINRKTPMQVGSIVSNMGHSEASSGMCAIAKVILSFENKMVPPNINFTTANPDIPALAEGRLQVVTNKSELKGSLIAINSFGFGGTNAHALFKANFKEKINNGAPADILPRLVTWSGRTEEAVNEIFDDIIKRPLDAEFIGLLHNSQLDSVPANVFRGYGVFAHKPNENTVCLNRSAQHYSGQKRSVVWVFSGMGSQWTQMGLSLMEIPLFRTSIEKCHNILASRGLNLKEIITSSETTFDNILHSFVGIAAIQIGLVDILKTLGMEPDLIIGHSVGELGCAYADGCFTAEEMILSAYSRGMASLETKIVLGSMAAIGTGFKQLRSMTPPEIEIACHNSADSCTISGPAQSVTAFVKELKSQGIFAKEVPCSNIPYHSSYISEMGPKLLSRLTEVIKSPKKRSAKWLSSSVPKQTWDQESCQYSSAQYHTNNLLSPVLFEETSALLPKEALTVEIAPHGLLQAIIKKSMLNSVHIPLTQRGHSNNAEFLIQALGKIHVEGVDIQISNLYPKINFPVSRGTQMISPLIKWDHSEDWFVTNFDDLHKAKSRERKVKVSLIKQEFEYLVGYTIDGRILFPATAYLFLVWETLANMKGLMFETVSVEFEDIKFLRATSLTEGMEIDLTVMIQPGTGRFEISESSTSLVTGFIKQVEKTSVSDDNDANENSEHPTLNSRDFYKELRLRGYHYNGVFKSVLEARSDGLKGKVRWDMNWVAFMDCLLQIVIIGKDTRSLVLPTGIQKLTIDTTKHSAIVRSMEDLGVTDKVFDVNVSPELNVISSGGVEITNLQANVVGRRRPPGIPVLEYYKFIPHLPSPILSLTDGVRVLVQLVLENVPYLKVKAVEVGNQTVKTILPIFQEALADLPLVTAELTLLSKQSIEIDGIVVENGVLSSKTKCLIVVATGCFNDNAFIVKSASSLEENGFIVFREKSEISCSNLCLPQNFNLISVINSIDETLILVQYKKNKINVMSTIIKVSQQDTKYEWLKKTKQSMKSGSMILVAQNEKTSGIIGLVNCLRKEPNGEMITCVFIDDDKAPLFELQNPLYSSQLNLGLAINVLKNGKWGSYRHLQIQQSYSERPARDHCCVNSLIKSDLSSLKWISGPFNYSQPEREIVTVQYASLNFRDVMLATGKLTADAYTNSRLQHDDGLGFEYSGITKSGKRIMGMTRSAAISSHIEMDLITFDCPDNWSLAEAATVPVVYGTVYAAFFLSIQIEKGKSILIHAGSGGVGLAAIRVAFAYGLEVFTTVSTTEKKNYLLQEFPQLKEQNIGNSRDISFEKLVLTQTKGKGVDYVLNSLSDEKLHASIRCLGRGGKFLEIGKFDIANDTKIGLRNFGKELSFHPIMLDKLFDAEPAEKFRFKAVVDADLKSGIIKPLKANIFAANQLEQAFRFLASGKHMGKVMLQIRDNERDKQTLPITVLPRVYCSPSMSYIIPGGLGGFGLELADWLVLRGCKNLILSSSRGVTKQYQAYRIKTWKSYGIKVVISTSDIKTSSGCENLIRESMNLGPIGGIFNLAVVLRDSILENQNKSMFDESMAPKAIATKHLDEWSRKLCPYLQYFVVFSSVSCGRGNAGQSNYGMANSVMERIMEQRHEDGLPAKAIQWGAIGEVGLVADMLEDSLDMEIGGTLQQRISSCLEEMNVLMTINEPIVSSMVVAEKNIRGGGKGNIIETVMNIMSIRDIKSVSINTSLSELGMDSLMAVEIKQTLEREYELFLSPQDLRALTFMKLKEFVDARDSNDDTAKLKLISDNIPMMLRNIGDELNSDKTILRLKSKDNSENSSSLALIIPGLEGTAGKAWQDAALSLNIPTFILQLRSTKNCITLDELVNTITQDVLELHKNVDKFYLIGHSFGSLIALKLANIFEENGFKGQIVLLDGSPMFVNRLGSDQLSLDAADELVQTILLSSVVPTVFPQDNGDFSKAVLSLTTWESRIDKLIELSKNQNLYSDNYIREMTVALFHRIRMILNIDLNAFKLLNNTPISFVRPLQASIIQLDQILLTIKMFSTSNIRAKLRAQTSHNDEVVISGISGRFPNSNNMHEFSDNLYNKVDMVDDDERRWRHTNPEIPTRIGKVNNIEKFDANFFGVHLKQAHTMDPQCRILLEHAYEAILDSGVNPKSLKGSRTGVFIGACYNESEKRWIYGDVSKEGFGIVGSSRAMLANRISFAFGFKGPSFTLDAACSSSMYALDCAFNTFRNGECDAAIVGGCSLNLHPNISLQFARLGVLAKDGFCRPFDKNACGYSRSEGFCVIFLQKVKDAKRVYANLVYSKTNCDGNKVEGITYPSGKVQTELLTEFYEDINIDPSTVAYVEAHSTGTVAGDPEECNAIDATFCNGRSKALPVGSVKSNMGHAEPASGVCSIAKIVLAFENKLIPPNINFTTIRPEIPALVEGRIKVVEDPQKLEGSLIAVNSFGFGGANAHALFKANLKEKINNGAPTDSLPRLVTWCGRTEEAVNAIFDDIVSRSLDSEYIGLLHNSQLDSVPANVFRGYGVFAHKPNNNSECINRSVQHYSGQKRPVVWVFSGMGSQWTQMGLSLMEIPLFRTSIENCHNILASRGLNLKEIITSSDTTFDNILHSFVGIAAIQIGLVDILKTLGMEPDLIIGHSVGELGCAYADGCFTAEEMILSAYSRGMASLETKVVLGSMAAIGGGYKKLRSMTPPEIEIACHNSADSCTISGPAQSVTAFVRELKSQGIFAKEVPCSNIPYHSSYISEMGPNLLGRLEEVIKDPKKRSAKWLSSSVPKQNWDQESCQYSSAQYHTNNLLSPVLFEETSALLPKEALTVEIAPHGLLQAIIKKSMLDSTHIALTQRENKNNAEFFIGALGKIHNEGVDIKIPNLYPKIEFPVSRGTAMISPHIKWDHSEDSYVMKYENEVATKSGERKVTISLNDPIYEFIVGHTIDGRVLFPATAYLFLAWESLALMKGLLHFNINVEFEDIKFLRATSLIKDIDVELTIIIQPGTERFEVSEGNNALVTGFIRVVEKCNFKTFQINDRPELSTLANRDFYKELRLRGYHYNGVFRSVTEARRNGLKGKVRWDMNWIAFMDCLLQIQILGKDTRSLILPTGIQRMTIDALKHMEMVKAMEESGVTDKVFDVNVSPELNVIQSGGVEIVNLKASAVGRRRPPGIPVLEYYKFIPHFPSPILSKSDGARVLVQLAIENVPTLKVKVVEVDTQLKASILPIIQEALADLPLVTAELTLLTNQLTELDGIDVEDKKLSTHTNCLIIVASDCIHDNTFIESSVASLEENGFFVAREKSDIKFKISKLPSNFQLISIIIVDDEVLFVLQYKKCKINVTSTIIKVAEQDTKYEWLEKTKIAMKSGPIILVAQNETTSGIIGLVNCLRKEPNGEMITCVFIDDDKAPAFDLQNPLYSSQLNLGLAINVLRNGKWGSYRHLQINQIYSEGPAKDHCYVNALIKSDLSSLKWISGPYNYSQPDGELVKIQYASLNFRDVMLATGKLNADVVGNNRLERECVLGLEFSGVTKTGKRVMGLTTTAAMATHVEADLPLLFNCPDDWTLAEAATIPAVYGTVYAAFFLSIQIKKGKSILIHAGSGGIGLSAIRVAFAYGLEVFTTVSTTEKKNYLLQEFPQLKEQHIGNSRDTSFEDMILIQTKGAGVDYVLNSLAEEKLQASIRCLGKGGKFLEIGKFDMANDTKIGLANFLKELSFHSIMLDNIFKATDEEKLCLRRIVEADLKSGIIKPLKTNIFAANQVEQAFRFLASGKHIGKVLLQIRENEKDEHTLPITVLPRVYCSPSMSYIIPGGLGGFGLELADWLVLRGCRNLVLSSSRGISNQYQAHRIKTWEAYGVRVVICTSDIKTSSGCENLIQKSLKLGPVGGIFNLAVVLKDSILENQNQILFEECMAPKAVATKHLDKWSRKLCPYLHYFVVFSSVSCGRGNAGQSNYGMANSVMERVMEQRHKDGLPAKAIQWGAVGEVGLVADMLEDKLDMEIGGTLQQRISSCLEEMDSLMNINEPVVSSMVVAEKKTIGSTKRNMIEAIMNIMSIRDIKSISMDTTFSELGMDSLMAVEIKQTLEREYDLMLSPQELRLTTFMKLKQFSEAQKMDSESKLEPSYNNFPTGAAMLMRNLGIESNSDKTILLLDSKNIMKPKSIALIVPGIEGQAGNMWNKIAQSIDLPTYILQLDKTRNNTKLSQITAEIVQDVLDLHKHKDTFNLIGYSFGSLICLELACVLEKTGKKGKIVLIDGSPLFLNKLVSNLMLNTEEELQNYLLSTIINIAFPEECDFITKNVITNSTWDAKIDKLIEFTSAQNLYSSNYMKNITNALMNRTKMMINLDVDAFKPLKSTPLSLIRPNQASVTEIDEDYGLQKLCKQKINLQFIDGNHSTVLDNVRLIEIINKLTNQN